MNEQPYKSHEEMRERLKELGELATNAINTAVQNGTSIMQALQDFAAKESKTEAERVFLDIFIEFVRIHGFVSPEKIPRHKPPKEFLWPLDKVTSRVFGGEFNHSDEFKRIAAESAADKKNGTEIDILAKTGIDGDALARLKAIPPDILRPYDLHILCAVAQLFKDGKKNADGEITFTIGQIWRMISTHDTPTRAQKEKVLAAVKRLACTWIAIDNSAEAAAYRYPLVINEFSMLNISYIRHVRVGDEETTIIAMTQYPQIMKFAEGRKQITIVPLAALRAGCMTDKCTCMKDYVIRRIARMPKRTGRIKLESVYDAMHAESKDEKRHTKERFFKMLDELKKAGYITDVERQEDAAKVTRNDS